MLSAVSNKREGSRRPTSRVGNRSVSSTVVTLQAWTSCVDFTNVAAVETRSTRNTLLLTLFTCASNISIYNYKYIR